MQLQNLTINNIYTFVFRIFAINLYVFVNAIILLKNRNSFVDTISNFIVVVAIFSNISYCYLKNIFYNKLNIKNIIKFIVDFSFIIVLKKIDIFDAKSINNLICSFDIYIYIVFNFILQTSIKIKFYRIITFYCLCIIDISNYKIFVFIKFYYKKFLVCVICLE